VSPD
jgi:ribosome biogenesis protein ENP2